MGFKMCMGLSDCKSSTPWKNNAIDSSEGGGVRAEMGHPEG